MSRRAPTRNGSCPDPGPGRRRRIGRGTMPEHAGVSRRAVLGGGAGLAGIAVLTLTGCGTASTPDAASARAPGAASASNAASSTSPSAPDPAPSTPVHVASPATTPHVAPPIEPHTQPPSTPHTQPPSTPHASPASSRAAATASPARPASSSAAPAGALAKLSAIPVGGSIAATQAGKPITLARPSAGTVAAFSAVCTHLGCTVNPGGPQLNCPCHGSVFDTFTGQVVHGPASIPLPPVAVHLADGYVVSG
jgi:cytochrome b6-f complex iron-sulfur subunit